MPIETATTGGPNRRPVARYQPLSSGRPQDPTLQEQAAAIAKQKAMAKGEELATPYLDGLFTSGVDKVKGFFNPASTPAVTQTAPLAEGATMAEVAAGAGGNAIGTIGTGLTEAAAANAATGAAGTGAMAGLSAAVPYIGAAMLAGKAFGLFNKGGYVNGPLSNMANPLSKVRYKQSGGPVNEEIEVSYGGPLSKGA